MTAIKQFVTSSGSRIYRIPCAVFPGLMGRIYLIVGAGEPTLVDAGSGEGESTAQIVAGIETVANEYGEPVRLADVRRILVTHAHIDHFGGLAELVRLTGAAVAAHPMEMRTIAAYDERAVLGNLAFAQFLLRAGVGAERRREILDAFGWRQGRVESVAVDVAIEDGWCDGALKAIHTPGHSPGHVCFMVDDVLIAGDHILAQTVSQLWPESVAPYTGLGHYLESLEKIRDLGNIATTLSGHEAVIEELPRRIEAIRLVHRRRCQRVLDMLGDTQEPLNLAEIAEKLYASQRGSRALLAMADAGARVEHLFQRGLIAIENYRDLSAGRTEVYRYARA